MLRRKAQRQFVLWLAWLAMAFLFVAPSISRVLPASAPAHSMAMMGGDCAHDMTPPSKPIGSTDPTDRCGYCALLSHQSLVAAYTILYWLPAAPPALVAKVYASPRIPSTRRLEARPRGPPPQA
nr:DUF2946 domain-containing protein [Dyella sp. C9]